MSDTLLTLDEMVGELLARATALNFPLEGPAETEYGYGWPGTLSLWFGNRRVHFYGQRGDHTLINVEAAEIFPGQRFQRGQVTTDSDVRLTRIQTTEEAWVIVDNFLRRGCSFDELPGDGWRSDSIDCDKFIPHPPNISHPANIVSLIKHPNAKPWRPGKHEEKNDAEV
jgi:hypothetical protein